MNHLKLTLLGMGALLTALVLNFRHAANDYGLLNNQRLHKEVLAQTVTYTCRCPAAGVTEQSGCKADNGGTNCAPIGTTQCWDFDRNCNSGGSSGGDNSNGDSSNGGDSNGGSSNGDSSNGDSSNGGSSGSHGGIVDVGKSGCPPYQCQAGGCFAVECSISEYVNILGSENGDTYTVQAGEGGFVCCYRDWKGKGFAQAFSISDCCK